MAGYGYTNRSGYNGYQGMEQTGYDQGYGNSDHLCRPVIIDVDGRKRPIISYNPNNSESYVTKTERIVETVHTPGMVSEYEYGSPKYIERRPQMVQEFITKVQTEVIRPPTSGPLSTTYLHNTPNSAGYNGATGYNEYSTYNNNNDWNKPSGNTIRDDRHDDYYRNKPSGNINRDDRLDDYYRRNESPMGPKGWTTTRPSHETTLSKPMNNIGAAVEFLKESAVASAVNAVVPPQARFMLPSSIVPKRDTYVETPKRDTHVETIDNKEAARRYGNFNSRLMKTAETYTGTIDSSEAGRKYNGSRV